MCFAGHEEVSLETPRRANDAYSTSMATDLQPEGMTGRQSLQIRVYESLDDLTTLHPAWEELLSGFPAATIFSTWEWLVPWWRAFGEGQRLMVLGFFDANGTLVGLAPLALKRFRAGPGVQLRSFSMMGDGSQDSENLDIPVCPGYEEDVASALLDYLETHAEYWDLCCLNTLPGHSPCGNALLRQLRRRGWTHFRFSRPGVVITLPDSWEAYRKLLSYNERAQLGRYQRRLEKKYKVRFYRCTRESDLDTCLDALFRLHQARWQLEGEAGSFASLARRRFYAEMGRLFLTRGWLEFWLLDLDGKTVGAEFDFRFRDTVISLQGGIDPDHWHDRVGYALRGHVLQQCIASGVRQYDFLGGDGGYKERWAGQVRNYRDVHFSRPFTRGSLYLRIVAGAGETKEWLRARLPKWGWSGLHIVNAWLRHSAPAAKPEGSKAVAKSGPKEE